MVARLASALMALAFVACAAVQHNDPDPTLWLVLYGASAILCIGEAAGRRWMSGAMLVAGAAVLWGAALIPQAPPPSQWFDSEVGRELGGLALVASWILSVAWRAR